MNDRGGGHVRPLELDGAAFGHLEQEVAGIVELVLAGAGFQELALKGLAGDVVFAFVDTYIVAIGVAQSYCWESRKPVEFSNAGQNWANVGWKVLRTVLPNRYSPLQTNGNGIQSIYLTEVPQNFAEVLTGLIGEEPGHSSLLGRSPLKVRVSR